MKRDVIFVVVLFCLLTVPGMADENWTPLFDGKSLDGWEVPKSAVAGEVKAEHGVIVLNRGALSTGIKYVKPFPKSDYEIMYQAKRVDGYDFFGAITFPVKESFCTFVNGGWGCGVTGLSSINGYDASENETTRYYEFETGKWYQFRVRVTDERITVWCTPLNGDDDDENQTDQDKQENKKSDEHPKNDSTGPKKSTPKKSDEKKTDAPLTDLKLEDKTISTRLEVNPYRPFGFTSWCTTGHLRDIKYRKIRPSE
ncbi:MAG: DUF1080 domain-containing protein [Planctomycetaceae bacterium]|nr:DUF1080 domain-containing protein [Planctomycetaceae bacterium]